MAIQAREREISRLTGRLAESRAQQAAIHEIATVLDLQLQEATMSMCNGGDHALRAARGLIVDQRRVIICLRNRLRHHLVPWSLDTSLATAAITGIDAPGLNLVNSTYILVCVAFSLSGFPMSSHSDRRRVLKCYRFG